MNELRKAPRDHRRSEFLTSPLRFAISADEVDDELSIAKRRGLSSWRAAIGGVKELSNGTSD